MKKFTNNFCISEVKSYAQKMKELVDYTFTNIYSCKDYGSFHFVKKMGAIRFVNKEQDRDNLIFSIQKVSHGTFTGWHSKVSNTPFPFKMEYYENDTPQCLSVSTYRAHKESHWDLDYHDYYSTEQLEDEGFLFQQSLLLDETALFGVCCSSWLWHMGVRLKYIICEFDVDEMNRVHKVVFDDDRP